MRTLENALVSLAFLVGATAKVRAECQPAAVPIGDPALVQTLSERLAASGITTTPLAGCPAVRVNVERRGQQVHLRVVDAYQRLGEREVRDVATAAAIIESWTLQEIEQGSPRVVTEQAPAVTTTAPIVPTGAIASMWIGASGRSSIGDDGSIWLGGAISGCMRLGWSCVGASVGFASETAAVEDVTSGTHRSLAIDAMATLDVPRRLGGFLASPGISAGYGWNRIQQQHLDMHSMPLSSSHANHSLRAGAHVVISRPFGRRIAIFGELFGDVAVLRTDIPDGPRARAGLSFGARFEAP